MGKTVKIAISGSHGTGKTTTVNALTYIFNNRKLEIIPEFARGYIEAHGNPSIMMEGKRRPVSQLLALLHYTVLEQVADSKNLDLIICDRGVIDSFAYVSNVGVDFDSYELKRAKELMAIHAQSYDHVFYHPIEFPLREDGVRDVDIQFQKDMDVAIRSAWKEANLDVLEITGTVADRAATISQFIFEKYNL